MLGKMEGRRRLGEGRPLNPSLVPVKSGHWLHPSFPRRGLDHNAPSPEPGFETNQRRGSLQRGGAREEWGPANRCRTLRTKGRGAHLRRPCSVDRLCGLSVPCSLRPKKGGNLCLTVILGALRACEGSGATTGAPRVDRGWLVGWGRQETQGWSDLGGQEGPVLRAGGALGTIKGSSGRVSAQPAGCGFVGRPGAADHSREARMCPWAGVGRG